MKERKTDKERELLSKVCYVTFRVIACSKIIVLMAINTIRSTFILGLLVAASSGPTAFALPAVDTPQYPQLPRSCEALQGDVCQDLGYKETIFPNLLNHESQEEAITDMKKYTPLIQGQCSDVLREFLCALHMPVCTNYGFHLPPCRALCRQVQSGCEEMMEAIGLPWPDKFDCTRFPEHHELMCVMSLSSAVAPKTTSTSTSTPIWRGGGFMGASLTQCVSNADCIFERSVCRAGECICEYPRTWGPYGCEETQILGGQCSTDEQCSAVTPNAVCSDSVCTCRNPMISYMNLACIHASEVGSLCYNDAQCRAVNIYSFCRYLVSQVVGTCACETDQFIDVRGRCSPRLGPVNPTIPQDTDAITRFEPAAGGRCLKGSCPRQLGAASCQRGKDASLKCFCRKDAVRRRGVCVPQ